MRSARRRSREKALARLKGRGVAVNSCRPPGQEAPQRQQTKFRDHECDAAGAGTRAGAGAAGGAGERHRHVAPSETRERPLARALPRRDAVHVRLLLRPYRRLARFLLFVRLLFRPPLRCPADPAKLVIIAAAAAAAAAGFDVVVVGKKSHEAADLLLGRVDLLRPLVPARAVRSQTYST